MEWAELIMRRKNIAEFILADSLKIEITRQSKPTRTAAGGTKPGKVEVLPEQRVRIVQNVRRYTAGLVNAEAGDIPQSLYVVLGRHTADIKPDDVFEAGGEKYLVLGTNKIRKEEYTLGTLENQGPANVRSESP